MDTRLFALGVAIIAFPICWLCERYFGFGSDAKRLAGGAMLLYGSYFALLIAGLVATGIAVGVLRLFGSKISFDTVVKTIVVTGVIALHVGALAVLINTLRQLQ